MVEPGGGIGPVVGVLLAGGQSRRMGGSDKSLKALGRRTILDHVIARAGPQVDRLVLNANGDPARFAACGLPVVADTVGGFAGPLAGVLAGMGWAAAAGYGWIATFATDAPFPPRDLVARLAAALGEAGADLACARSGGRAHPVFGLWPVRLRQDLRRALVEQQIRKVDAWTARHRLVHVDFPAAPRDPFFNINRPCDLTAAEAMAGTRPPDHG